MFVFIFYLWALHTTMYVVELLKIMLASAINKFMHFYEFAHSFSCVTAHKFILTFFLSW